MTFMVSLQIKLHDPSCSISFCVDRDNKNKRTMMMMMMMKIAPPTTSSTVINRIMKILIILLPLFSFLVVLLITRIATTTPTISSSTTSTTTTKNHNATIVSSSSISIVFVPPNDDDSNNNNNDTNNDTNNQKRKSSTTMTIINPTYASFNIDGSYNRGFFHINFTNPNLLAATKSLAPFILRFGGTGNDYLHYNCETNNPAGRQDSDTYGCFNTTHRTNLFNFINKAGGKFLFGVSFDMTSACQSSSTTSSSYRWNATEFIYLLNQMKGTNQTVWGYELGNEINNRAKGGNAHCGNDGLVPHQQADGINLLYKTIQSYYPNLQTRPKIVGPDTGYYKPDYWLNNTLSRINPKNQLFAVTHHVYPGINRENYNNPKVLDRVLNDIHWYVPIIQQYAPQAQIWAGEDGPTGGGEDGTCGSNSICGLYGSILWYADDMALRAKHGFHQYHRQDLIGGRYSLIGIQHDNQALNATSPVQLHPDYWINFLWKRIVGSIVLKNVTLSIQEQQQQQQQQQPEDDLRVYAFMGEPSSKYSVVPSNKDSITLIVINLNNITTSHLSIIEDDVVSTTSWMIIPHYNGGGSENGAGGGCSSRSTATTSNNGGGPFGTRAELNGILLPYEISNGRTIDDIPVKGITTKGNIIVVDPISVTFVRLHYFDKEGNISSN